MSCAMIKKTAGHAVHQSIAQLRRKAGLTQSELAGKTGTSERHIRRLESGRYHVSGRLLQRLAQVLNCQVSDLMAPEGTTGIR